MLELAGSENTLSYRKDNCLKRKCAVLFLLFSLSKPYSRNSRSNNAENRSSFFFFVLRKSDEIRCAVIHLQNTVVISST